LVELRLGPPFGSHTSSVDFIAEEIFIHCSYMTPELLIQNLNHEFLHILIWKLTHLYKATQFLDSEIASELLCPVTQEVRNQGFGVRYT